MDAPEPMRNPGNLGDSSPFSPVPINPVLVSDASVHLRDTLVELVCGDVTLRDAFALAARASRELYSPLSMEKALELYEDADMMLKARMGRLPGEDV